jgi:hypothetical protein
MTFNLKKCCVMSITSRRNKIVPIYMLGHDHDEWLVEIFKFVDLRIKVTYL